jgi:cell division transport system permease protein
MTVAAVLTVAVSLSLVGAALLLKQGASNAEVVWQHDTQVIVYLRPAASTSEIGAVKAELAQLPYVRQPCVYADKQQNYDLAKKIEPPGVVSSLSVASMVTSYSCVPSLPDDATLIVSHFTGQPGVYNVLAPLKTIHTQQRAISIVQVVLLVMALVLLISASVLILNTIRMAIFARRREVSVMKLVGATNWFIRIPFMSEGLLQGLAGSAVAAFGVYLLHLVFDHFGNPNDPQALFSLMRMSGWQVFWTDTIVVLLGILIGSVGSAVAIRRFLDV